MFEAVMVGIFLFVLFGLLWYAVHAADEYSKQYPNREELDDFFWDEEYTPPKT